MVIFSNGGSSVSDSTSEFSSAVIAMNSFKFCKDFFFRDGSLHGDAEFYYLHLEEFTILCEYGIHVMARFVGGWFKDFGNVSFWVFVLRYIWDENPEGRPVACHQVYRNLVVKSVDPLTVSDAFPFIRSQASVRINSHVERRRKALILRGGRKRDGEKESAMKAVLRSYPMVFLYIVPSLSSSSHVFASPVSDRGNIIRRTTSFFSISVFKHITDSEEFMNVFMRIGFGSSIKLVSLDKSQVVTFDSKFVSSFRNSDCRTQEGQSGKLWSVLAHMGSSSIG
ncbi:hypothetical protein Tco_0772023 [Tanacetum coccineum]|uniref:Uncharacterized protein n=1 Tax=Tanacetum coccineum TaxID=301880 RepID=A0ABQ4ZHU2_9ASTR